MGSSDTLMDLVELSVASGIQEGSEGHVGGLSQS